ncbi:MAG: DNA repair protein RecN [Hyphomicrobiales bacterium]|nr:DNA repair protein RecN [Hyphomicrobiales bacterium]
MLAALSIRDIVLIERLDLDFSAGLTVLTGETGAGKSILLDALALALGARGDAALVRHGAERGQVTAEFHLDADHPVSALLLENDISAGDTLILRRVQSADGRSRAFINDQPVGVNLLQAVGSGLVEIHGQHADRALIDAAAHRRLLDAFGGLEAQVSRVGEAWQAQRTAAERCETHRRRMVDAARETEFLRDALDELDRLEPTAGEETELADRRQLMMKAEKIVGDLDDAFETLNGQSSPIPTLAGVLRRLERKSGDAPELTEAAIAALDRGLEGLEEARTALEDALRRAAFDPSDLERTEERLFALRAAARKHKVAVDDLADLRERFRTALSEIDAGEEHLKALEAALEKARADYAQKAATLSRERSAAADALCAAVNRELPALKLDRAEFKVDIEPAATATSEGIDSVEFWVQTNPGTRPGPIIKVASGGELARFLLALKVALADKGSAPTLVFDEIDTGIGGAVAEAIGKRLGRLAETVQVLSVTHAPQVAARADHHLRIAKIDHRDGERVETAVEAVAGDHRREEIARMLAGATITEEARAAAARLIAGEG